MPPDHQRLSLSNRVDHQTLVVCPQILSPIAQRNKLHRNDIRALVKHLKEGMLAIGSGLTPNNGGGWNPQFVPMARHALAIALHLQLLEISRQAAQAMAIRCNTTTAEAAKVAIPYIQQPQAHG